MQMDKTRIAVRERNLFELMDLALQLCRVYARPLFLTLLLGALPCSLLNYYLIGWMASPDYIEYASIWLPWRYAWTLTLLTLIEAPVATMFIAAFLGKAVFEERPPVRQVVRDVWASRLPLVAFQATLRGTIPAWILVSLVDDGADYSMYEFWLILLTGWALLWRMIRPFLNEIILLERNPWRSSDPQVITIRRRNSALHGAAYGELFARWIGCAWIGTLLTVAIGGNLVFLLGVFTSSWEFSWGVVTFLMPFTFWVVAGYFAVVRFLGYIDLRIRLEGWEVELRLRAEAARLAGPALGGVGDVR